MRDEKSKFHETVGILVKAYLNNDLQHSNCSACAVGNIIHHHYGNFDSVSPWDGNDGMGWPNVFCTVALNKQLVFPENCEGNAKEQIDATGYTWQELALVEKAFEHCYYARGESDDDETMFSGLMAVVDVLGKIHGIDLTEKEQAKLLFHKA